MFFNFDPFRQARAIDASAQHADVKCLVQLGRGYGPHRLGRVRQREVVVASPDDSSGRRGVTSGP
ncbi:hypothetical protein, partial [Mycolicibacter algericus]|uniref:hypothetical protein n=1 Tax=Mycolicibacter algericus TaxID=1288388 RepID=UPI0021F373C5